MDFIVYLEAHQPLILRKQPRERVTSWLDLVDEHSSSSLFEIALKKSYEPLFKLLSELAPTGFKVGLRVSGILLDQAERWGKVFLEELASLVAKGVVDLVAGPYYNSITFLLSQDEYVEQVEMHVKKLVDLFGVRPKVLSNPYLAYSDEVGRLAYDKLEMQAVITEGASQVLGWRTPHFVYRHPVHQLKVLTRDPELSNEIAFGLGRWLRADFFTDKVTRVAGSVVLVGVPMETFGLSVPREQGAFDFLRWLPREVAKRHWVRVATPSEVAAKEPVDLFTSFNVVTWLETKDLRPLTENPLQAALLSQLGDLREHARAAGLNEAWRLLTQVDLLYAARGVSTFTSVQKAMCALYASVSP
ncbi:MAG: hypothetical protein QXY49_06315 [Thermofilaceae archaeon]